MADRKIAIILTDERRLAEVRHTVDVLMANAAAADIAVFSKEDRAEFNMAHEGSSCRSERFPECGNPERETALRNAVLRKYEAEGFSGTLHVLSDGVRLLKDPGPFMDDLEAMMKFFDYPLWLSTVTDPCNYVYKRYNPRLALANDAPELAAAGLKSGVAFTSHSNTAWMAYDLGALASQKDIEYFSEDFDIAMFYIVELLARRRAKKRPGQLFFMNQYMTVQSELGTFEPAEQLPPLRQTSQDQMSAEDAVFKQVGADYAPDNSLDVVIDAFAEKLLQKGVAPAEAPAAV